MKRQSVVLTVIWVIVASFGFTVIGLGLLWVLNRSYGWNLDVLVAHAGFFQAWIYILQTFALIATLIFIGLQTRAAQRATAVNTVQLMVTSHRELLNKMVDRPELMETVLGDDIPEEPSLTVYMSMILNHGLNAFTLRQQDYIDDDWWAAIVRDMKDIIGRGAMRQWWSRVKNFYPLRYQEFIDQDILGSWGER